MRHGLSVMHVLMDRLSIRPVTEVQRRILQTFYDPMTGTTCTGPLHCRLYACANTLVQKGWIWRKRGKGQRHPPTYGLTRKGISAAKAAWEGF